MTPRPHFPPPPVRVKAVDSQVMLTVRVEAELERRLANLARATGRTKSHYAREAIMRLLAEKKRRSAKLRRSRCRASNRWWVVNKFDPKFRFRP